MRLLAKLAVLLLLAVAALLLLALESKPLVDRGETLSPAAVAQARRLFAANDPRRMTRGEERQATIPAALIDEGINYLACRALHGRGALVLGDEAAEIRLSLRSPVLSGSHFINLRATIREAEGEPRIAAASIGSLPIPAALAEFALTSVVRMLGYEREWLLARRAILHLAFEPAQGTVVVRYAWDPALLERARAIAFSPEDLALIQEAQTSLASLFDHKAAGTPMALSSVLRSLLTAPHSDSREQRRAILLVLTTYLAEKNLAAIIPQARTWPQPRSVVLTLHSRYDSAQHFVISAALAAWAGEPAADAIGLYKELDDARHGWGFSFADLSADRAGTRFGQLLAQGSNRLDEMLRSEFADADLAPQSDDLPEYLSEQEFRRRFSGPGSPAYQQVTDEIERRLMLLPLYRHGPG